jgi:hypothetical protein
VSSSSVAVWRQTILGLAVTILISCNILQSYSLNQFATMYDNPVYRWRESLAIALSWMRDKPAHGYVAYRSIRDFLAQHGLGLIAGEVDPLPTAEERTALVFDGPRMQQLIEQASKVPVDESLPPVTLNGNELGLADFYYWAFEIFGLKIQSLSLFYYFILTFSCALFFFTFRRSPFFLYLLMLYLIGHFYMLGYGRAWIYTVHNSRFFPVLALLPTMHLLLLVIRGPRPTLPIVAGAVLQAFILYFCVFCRLQAMWQALAVISGPVVLISFGSVRELFKLSKTSLPRLIIAVASLLKYPGSLISPRSDSKPRGQGEGFSQSSSAVHVGWTRRPAIRHLWPAAVTLLGLLGFLFYMSTAFDQQYYATESRSHTFWDPLYVGTVSASPELSKIYDQGAEPYSDALGYLALIHDLRERHEIPPEIGYVTNGLIWIDPYKNMGVYDRLMRRAFFDVVFAHPWLVLKSFIYDKPHDQVDMLSHTVLAQTTPYIVPFAMALGATIVALFCGASLRRGRNVCQALKALLMFAVFSTATTIVTPSPLIPDTILYYLFVTMLLLTSIPMATISHLSRAYFGRQSLGIGRTL